jgi:transcriptional regulator with XRE-family HTH domain
MDFYSMTDKGIETEIGRRIRSLRLRRNLTQQDVAEAAALSLNTIKALEAGKGKLASLIAVLRELGALDELDNLIPEAPISPLQLAKQQGKVRQRASGKRVKESGKEKPEW